MTLLAAVLAAGAAWLQSPPGRWVARHRLALDVEATRPSRSVLVAAMVLLVVWVTGRTALSGPHLILAVTIAGVVGFGVRQWRSGLRRKRLDERRRLVSEAIGLMAAELRAGLLPQRVLSGLAPDFEFLAPAARAADLGGDVPAALRATAEETGAGLLAELAGAWLVAERAGAPLARVLDRLEETARGDLEIEREVESGLAPARATGRLMAVLPVFGLALGSGMGADPVAILTGTYPGVVCLAAGCALACAGVAWVERIAASAEAES
ncbi:type II secretion system F family protein [Aeromicrobium sp. NPDC092404]|uniref:type II secretion system F family protein n=1 Tax=Aeromicrobium sp. NPDC092404 TaxID=3154976 RepID=UPI0034179F0A